MPNKILVEMACVSIPIAELDVVVHGIIDDKDWLYWKRIVHDLQGCEACQVLICHKDAKVDSKNTVSKNTVALIILRK